MGRNDKGDIKYRPLVVKNQKIQLKVFLKKRILVRRIKW